MLTSFGLLALALTTAPVQDATDFVERFQLFNNCKPCPNFGAVLGSSHARSVPSCGCLSLMGD